LVLAPGSLRRAQLKVCAFDSLSGGPVGLDHLAIGPGRGRCPWLVRAGEVKHAALGIGEVATGMRKAGDRAMASRISRSR
jgi:hypothetical protein